MHRFDVKTIKNRKTTKAIKLLSICIDLTSKRSKIAKLQKQSNYYQFASIWRQNDQKCWVTSQNIQNNAKLRKSSNYNELHRFDVKNIKPTQNYKSDLISMNLHRFDVRTIKTTQNYESDQIIMHCIDLTSKRSKKLSYVPKLQKWSNYNELHRFDVKTIKNRKTTKAIKFLSICIDLRSKRSKMLSYVANHSKQPKTTKVIKLQWIASIWCQNDQKSQNYKSNQITINLHRFDVKTIKNVELRRKTFKTTQNYESHQITMNCIDLMSKTSNQRKTTKVILFRWICIDLTSERSKQR